MARKTREQVWRELDALGEEEVRQRLAARPEDVGEAGLVREWLDEKARAAIEVPSTREASDPSEVPSSVPEAMAARSGLDPRTVGIIGIFLLGILYTLYFARAFLLPVTIAILLNFLLSPAVRALKRLRLPEPVGAALVVLGCSASRVWGPMRSRAPPRGGSRKGRPACAKPRPSCGI
jgi:hypothetical protein